MANKREFKKMTEAFGASLVDQMMVVYYNIEGVDKAKIESAIGKVLHAVGKATANSNTFFDKGRKAFDSEKDYIMAKKNFFKQMFKKITTDYSAEIDEAMKEFNSAIPAGAKEVNKKIAAAV